MIMENNLDLLTKKLYAEGVEKARVEAEALLSGARAQAEKLVADAMQEAVEIRKRAEQDVAALAKKSETELEASTRMAVDAFDGIAVRIEREAFRAERHALVQLHVVADDRCLADDDPRAVVDGEIVADGGTRVDVDAGLRMRHLGDDARDERHVQPQQGVGDAVVADGAYGRVAKDDLTVALGSRVAVVGGHHVGLQLLPDVGQLFDERGGFAACHAFQAVVAGQRAVEAQPGLDLPDKQPLQPLHVDADVVEQGLLVDDGIAEIAGEQQRPGDAYHLAQGFDGRHGHVVALFVAEVFQLSYFRQLLYDMLHVHGCGINC